MFRSKLLIPPTSKVIQEKGNYKNSQSSQSGILSGISNHQNSRQMIIQRDGESNDAFSFNFDFLPPEMKMKLGMFMLQVNTGSSELSFTQDLMKTTLGYSYGGDLYLGSSGGGYNSRFGFNPSSDQFSLGLGYDQFRLSTSFNPVNPAFGLGLGYGSGLLPMPWALRDSVYKGEAAAENALGSIGSMTNPYQWYTDNSGNIDSVMSTVKSVTSVGNATEGSFGAGLNFTYNPQSGILIYGGMQWIF
jgi:hypothetical protein